MEVMAGGRLWSYFHGLWTFQRKVCTLQPPHRLLASISGGHASFIPWTHTTEQTQHPETTELEWTSPSGVRSSQASEDSSASGESPGRIVLQEKGEQQPCLLYREQGMLNNHESDFTPAALVNRQYLYCFPALDSHPVTTEINVYHCSAKDRSAAVLDPYTVPVSALSSCFSPGEHFHDLKFPDIESGIHQGALVDVKSQCTHYCDPDVYEGEFCIQNDARFTIRWTVTGPQKSYSIETDYEQKQP